MTHRVRMYIEVVRPGRMSPEQLEAVPGDPTSLSKRKA
jgi:hypothetical protein